MIINKMFKASNAYRFARSFNSLSISEEVKCALSQGKPVVALESTIITHGLPFPQNLEMAVAVENIIRSNNAVPATTAFINGIPKVGLARSEIEQLASYAKAGSINKVSRRDIAYTMAKKLFGGTTISSTMILSHMAGIKVFATGGLGGVHRGAEITMDVSADLEELGRTPVAVVCAGPKAILDIEKTMEYLETKGCLVATQGPPGVKVPGFYSRSSGVTSPYNFENFEEAASMIHSGLALGLKSGYLMCIPPPAEVALSESLIETTIHNATIKAFDLGIKGKKLTPFLLSEIARETQGQSVKSNIEFVLNNAKAAAQIASNLVRLEHPGQPILHQPSSILQPEKNDVKSTSTNTSVVIGSIALDTHCSMTKSVRMSDSNPGCIRSAIGGVGHNVALAANLSNKYPTVQTKLISSLGNDLSGSAILKKLKLSSETLHVDNHNPTAQYVSVHSNDGELLVACADMDIPTKIPTEFVSEKLRNLEPKVVIADANISIELIETLMRMQKDLGYKLIFEPTSESKAMKLANLRNLGAYPENQFYLITPTVSELHTIFETFKDKNKFDVDTWFPILDSLQVDTALKRLAGTASIKNIQEVTKNGILQMACYLLPYFPNIIVKDGANGLFVFSIIHDVHESCKEESHADYSFVARGMEFEGKQRGILFEHYQVPKQNVKVKNVTGAGDTFLGVLSNDICYGKEIFQGSSYERYTSITRAQMGAVITVEDSSAVSENLSNLA